jgi:hypothetical protein
MERKRSTEWAERGQEFLAELIVKKPLQNDEAEIRIETPAPLKNKKVEATQNEKVEDIEEKVIRETSVPSYSSYFSL